MPPATPDSTRNATRANDLSDEGLVRRLGVRALAANIVNQTVGSGIFVLPAAVAAILGPAAVIAYLVSAVGIGLIGLCYAEVGSRITRSGGMYAYISSAFGPFVGYLGGVLLWFGSDVVSQAAISVVVVDSAAAALGLGLDGETRAVVLLVLFAGLAAANIRGVAIGAALVEVVTAAKLVPLVLVVALGLVGGSVQHLVWTRVPSAGEIASAALLLVFAFTGTETALTASGEIERPADTVPRAILVGLGSVSVLYVAVQLAAQSVLGPDLAAEETAPLAATAMRVAGDTGRQAILAGTLISAFGFLSGNMLASPRMLFAFGRAGLVPRFFGSVHPRYRTPHVAIATHAVLGWAFAITGSFRALAVLSVVPTLLVLLGCCLAALVLRRRDVREAGEPFLVPGGPAIPLIAVTFIVWLLFNATWREMSVVAVMLLVASVVYWVRLQSHETRDSRRAQDGSGPLDARSASRGHH